MHRFSIGVPPSETVSLQVKRRRYRSFAATTRVVVIIAFALLTQVGMSSRAIADATDEGSDTLFGIVYVTALAAATVLGIAVLALIHRRDRNPATGLPRPIKRRRARGTLRRFIRLQ